MSIGKIELKKQLGWWLVYPLVAISLLLNFYFYHRLESLEEVKGKYKVVKVLDGDSFTIHLGQSIRLADLNAPDMGLCLAQEAKEKLEELVLGKFVKIEEVVGKDKFGRILALAYIDGQLVNEVMVRGGLARYASGRSKEGEKIKRAGEGAKEKGIGVWSEKCYQKRNLENPECVVKGNINKHDRIKIYHFPGCSEYERTVVELDLGEEWFCTEEEAQKAGYRKSDHCFE